MLTGKTALVTGAARGIGKAIALKLAKQGAYVIVNYSGSEEKAKETVEEIIKEGGQAEAIRCNVADFEACKALSEEILNKHGKLDILVNNAGITKDGLILKMSDKDFSDVLDVNLKGAFYMIQLFSKNFVKLRGGKIINISSVSGVSGNAGQANYSASKAGIIGLTKSVAKELASRNVCVNAVAPGFIQTDMTDAMTDSAKEAVLGAIPMKKVGKPEDIANVVAFLAGSESDYITGQVICVDGGMVM